ncbi:MAG: LPXTG cell wall anchor domain-containing protein [Blautia sp.]|nr:LPXTG cell wall anchor domain-containing protein [Blautia sp.]
MRCTLSLTALLLSTRLALYRFFRTRFPASPSRSIRWLHNNKGQELPSTGGMGTTIFYIIGAILVIGAGILLVTRRRMNSN